MGRESAVVRGSRIREVAKLLKAAKAERVWLWGIQIQVRLLSGKKLPERVLLWGIQG